MLRMRTVNCEENIGGKENETWSETKIKRFCQKTKQTRGKRKVKQKQDLHWIGDQYHRWTELKTVLQLEMNSEVAEVLLDR